MPGDGGHGPGKAFDHSQAGVNGITAVFKDERGSASGFCCEMVRQARCHMLKPVFSRSRRS